MTLPPHPPQTSERPATLTRGDGQPKPVGTWDWYGKLDPLHNPQTIIQRFSITVFRWTATPTPGVTRPGRTVKRFLGTIKHPEPVYAQAREFIRDLEARSLTPVPDRLDAARTLILAWRDQAQQEAPASPARATLLACAEQLEQTVALPRSRGETSK